MFACRRLCYPFYCEADCIPMISVFYVTDLCKASVTLHPLNEEILSFLDGTAKALELAGLQVLILLIFIMGIC